MTKSALDVTMSDETGDCKKCTTTIPLKAERCPQCGYEPGKAVLGPIGAILGFLLLMGGGFQILVGVLSLLTVFVGVPITSAVVGAVLFLGIGGIQITIADWLGKFGTHYAAEQPDEVTAEEDKQSFKEALEEGYQRGEERKSRVRQRIDALSPQVFTSFVIVGAAFGFLSLIIIGAETEIAGVPPEDLFVIPFIMSMSILAFTVLADIGRVNRVYEANHRWWVWVFSSMIPIVGFIPALGWVWRRQKTEKIAEE